jgi:hypothetical protein
MAQIMQENKRMKACESRLEKTERSLTSWQPRSIETAVNIREQARLERKRTWIKKSDRQEQCIKSRKKEWCHLR